MASNLKNVYNLIYFASLWHLQNLTPLSTIPTNVNPKISGSSSATPSSLISHHNKLHSNASSTISLPIWSCLLA